MKILITSATSLELELTEQYLKVNAKPNGMYSYLYKNHHISTLVMGIGSVHVAFNMARYSGIEDMDLLINIGIAGAYDRSLNIGEVVAIAQDCFADMCIEEADGSTTHIANTALQEAKYPYDEQGWMNCDLPEKPPLLRYVKSLTLNTVTGTESRALNLIQKHHAHIESMESGGFVYAAKMLRHKHLALRSISNYVEKRNKENWNIPLALKNLNTELIGFLDSQ